MKPFNLEEAKAGKPVCTRDGRPVRIVDFNIKNDKYPILALVDDKIIETPQVYKKNGMWDDQEQGTSYDLFMKETKKRGWVNITVDEFGDTLCRPTIYPTKDEAIIEKVALKIAGENIVDTIKIEWKE